MWSPSRSELSLAPTLGYLAAAVVAGVFVIDGSLGALTGRLTRPREQSAPLSAIAGGAAAHAVDDAAGPSLPEQPSGGQLVVAAEAEQGGSDGAGGAAGAVSAGASLPALLDDPCVDGPACKRRALDAFFVALGKSRQGELGRALRLSMFGDSVVATDEIPGRLRRLAVSELGDGGPGFVYAHPPHRFCGHEAITRSSSGTWSTYAVSTTGVRDRLYGYGGSTAQTVDGSVVTKIKGEPVSHVALHYLAQPRGGTVQVVGADGASPLATFDSRAERAVARVTDVAVAAGTDKVSVRTDGQVRFFGMVLERDRGAVVDNLGIVSVNAKNFARNDRAHFTEQVRARAPDLVLVMIGANEAQWLQGGTAEMKDYTARFTEVLAPIRAGGSACLVVAPLDQVEVTEGAITSRKIAPRMAQAQRAAAEAVGCGFFDTLAWMGGPGSAVKWRRRGLLGGDYIHLTRKGAERLGDALYQALFAAPRAAPGAAP